uniref:Vasohibin 1 n=1 Tax=Lynx canadensis TaxID=61383 RepID=A0A667HPS8_LYNCA
MPLAQEHRPALWLRWTPAPARSLFTLLLGWLENGSVLQRAVHCSVSPQVLSSALRCSSLQHPPRYLVEALCGVLTQPAPQECWAPELGDGWGQKGTALPEQARKPLTGTCRYNHTGTQFFEIKKSRPLTGLMDLAKEMTKEALPIKCLEAVILGIYLTNSMPTLERFPISFKTYFSGNYFRHIVLGVNFGGRYGALGMSRREDLMYKPPAFRTLSELVLDYEAAYGRCWHVLKKVKLGQCVSHDPHSVEQIEWKHSVLDVDRLGREDFRKELERHARDMRLKIGKGTGPPSPTKDRKKDVSSPQRGQSSPHRRNSRSERR